MRLKSLAFVAKAKEADTKFVRGSHDRTYLNQFGICCREDEEEEEEEEEDEK